MPIARSTSLETNAVWRQERLQGHATIHMHLIVSSAVGSHLDADGAETAPETDADASRILRKRTRGFRMVAHRDAPHIPLSTGHCASRSSVVQISKDRRLAALSGDRLQKLLVDIFRDETSERCAISQGGTAENPVAERRRSRRMSP